MYLDVVVTTRSGAPVTGLQQQDFTLLDNKAPQAIMSFQAFGGSQAPVEVILLVDAVNIPYTRLVYERDQIGKFLRANGGRLAHPTALAIFTDTGTQIQEGSSDGNALSASLDQADIGLRGASVRRSSGIYGAEERVQLSLRTLQQLAAREAARPGRKIVLWVSPGWPLLSGPRVDLSAKQQRQIFAEIVNLSTALREARMTLYSIDPIGAGESVLRGSYYKEFVKGVSKPDKVDIGDLGLQVLAAQTGGLALNASNDVTALLQRCMADTEAYYELSFDSLPADHRDDYHHLEVQIAKPGFVARARQGYYSQPQ